MRNRIFIFLSLVLALGLSGRSSLAQGVSQGQPEHPRRDVDTGQLVIERAPVSARLTAAWPSGTDAPQAATGLADWSKLTYQSYIGNWDVFSANGDGTQALRLTSSGVPDVTPRFNRGATRIAFASSEPGNYEIFAINPNGSGKMRVTSQAANDYNPAWSPDGSKLLFNSYRDGQSEIYVMNADGTNPVRLTYEPAYDGQPVWSPDGTKIAFLSDRSGSGQIWVMQANGHGPSQLTNWAYAESPAWSPDGTRLAFDADVDGDGWQELAVINADGSGAHAIGDSGTTADMWARSWSPDGRYVAFTAIYFVYYYGNWYWTAAYSLALDTTTGNVTALGGSDTDWYPDWQTTDVLPPTSSMMALPAVSASPIGVSWSGGDAGPSGILGYDVQVKDGAGAWTPWLTRTAQTAGSYSGVGGHTYAFRVRAVDNANNLQAWSVDAQASTTVEALPPVSAINPLPEYQRGELPVSWSGSDLGGSGIKSYDVQYRDGITGTWTSWQAGTTLTTANFNGTAGHTYSFRVRATDRAQNLGDWSNALDNVTYYAWQLVGQVRDTRGYRVVDAQITLSPTALNTITSTAAGYLGYGALTGGKSVEIAQPGYGLLPPMHLNVSADRKLDHFLKPQDNVIANGDFETDFSGWKTGGLQPPLLTTTIKHTGEQAALLGHPFDWTVPTSVGESSSSADTYDMATDPFGNLHVVWKTYGYGGDVIYVTRSKFGVWSTPVLLEPNANWEWQGPAVAADALGHVYAAWGSLAYATREPDGTWSGPASIAGGCCFGPQLQVDQQNTLHAMWDDSGSVYHASKPLGQDWTVPEVVGGGIDARFKVGSDGSLHAVWAGGGVAYATKPVGAAWSSPVNLSNSLEGIPDIAVDGQNLPHVVWIGSGGNVMYTHETVNGLWSSPVGIAISAQFPVGSPAIAVIGPATIGVALYADGALKFTESTDDLPWQETQTLGPAAWGTAHIELDDQGLPQVAWQASSGIVQSGPAPVPLAGDSWLTQTLSVPGDMHQPTLSFLYRLSGALPNSTWLELSIDSETTTLSMTLASNTADWAQKWIDMQPWAGQPITLSFRVHQTLGLPGAWAYIDDVTLGSWLTPDPQTIEPVHLTTPASQVITITGDNFFATPQVRLNDVPLADVTWVNTTTLTATVPLLPFGRYDLIVTNPGGQASGLPRALLVGYEVMLPIVRK